MKQKGKYKKIYLPILLGVAALIGWNIDLAAVAGIIFVAWFENLKIMDSNLFYIIAFSLFSSLGFAVNETIEKFLFKRNNK